MPPKRGARGIAAAKRAEERKTSRRDEAEDEEQKDDERDEAVDDSEQYFAGMVFAFSGSLAGHSQSEARRLLTAHGATVASSITAAVTHVLAASTDSARVQSALSRGTPVLRPSWLNECVKRGGVVPVSEQQFSWAAADEEEEEPAEEERSPAAKKAKRESTVSPSPPAAPSPAQMKTVVLKGRAAVDDYCPVAGQCHVIDDASGVHDAALNQTNIGSPAAQLPAAALHRCPASLEDSRACAAVQPRRQQQQQVLSDTGSASRQRQSVLLLDALGPSG